MQYSSYIGRHPHTKPIITAEKLPGSVAFELFFPGPGVPQRALLFINSMNYDPFDYRVHSFCLLLKTSECKPHTDKVQQNVWIYLSKMYAPGNFPTIILCYIIYILLYYIMV